MASEVESFLTWLRGAEVAPTVAALRARADEVVGAELRRLDQRRPDLTDEQRAEVAHTVHRVVQRLLHSPDRTGASARRPSPAATSTRPLLRELFDSMSADAPDTDVEPDRAVAVERAKSVERAMTLRLGTRGSALALAQSGQVAAGADRRHRRAGRAGRDRDRAATV